MRVIFWTGFFSLLFCVLFLISFIRDRSKYRNCYYLFMALVSVVFFILSASGPYFSYTALTIAYITLLVIMIVPFFLIYNGIVMIRKEGKHLSQLLSLILGLMILAGEITMVTSISLFFRKPEIQAAKEFSHSFLHIAGAVFSISVIYLAVSFFIFMLYTLFLQVIPRKKDFDYVIIHGAGLLDGNRVSKLLQDRLDKAVEVYRKDPTPPKMIPSGGKGPDESISEAEAMKRYLLARSIPECDIIAEDASTTTLENLQYSKEILDRMEGRKYTALVSSNYHVYRALRYCKKIGLKCTGIGSHVAFYYWPSALIREFIAIHSERKHTVIFFAGWLFCIAALLAAVL